MAQKIEAENAADDLTVYRYSSASLAFLGDSVFELKIRSRIIDSFKGNADLLNKRSKDYTNARAQAQMADILKDSLTDTEFSVYKRGRNYKAPSVPKSCTVAQYRKATGLEALMGYLFLEGEDERINELIDLGVKELDKLNSTEKNE